MMNLNLKKSNFLLKKFFKPIVFIWILIHSNISLSPVTHLIEWQLISVNGINLSIQIYLDSMAHIFVMVVGMISVSVLLFTLNYMKKDSNILYFLAILGAFVSSMVKLIMCPHMINLMAGWDGLGLTSYLLVIYYMNDKSMAAGMITLMTNRIGDALLIAGCALAFGSGHWNFVQNNYKTTVLIMSLLFLATMTKSAQLPFSAWLPAAMAAPTPVSALVHSSTLVTAGIYLLIRFYSSLSQYELFHSMALIVGTMTCMLASMSAMYETDLKKIIALSTLSQLGVMMMAIGIGKPQVAFFHLLTHALFKALLFICAGNIIHSMQDNQDIRLMGNISSSMPFTTTALNIANLSLCGLPFMAGFYSKDSIIENFMMSNVSLSTSILLMLSITMTAAYSIRLSLMTLWSPFKGPSMKTMDDENTLIHISYFILLMGAIFAGVVGYWRFLPSIKPMILPTLLKMLTLILVIFFGVFMWYYTNNDKSLKGSHYMTSMWFLSFISSSPLNSCSVYFSNILMYNEQTWMEKMSGKGIFKMCSMMIKKSEKMSYTNLSSLLSTSTVVWFMLMTVYFSV